MRTSVLSLALWLASSSCGKRPVEWPGRVNCASIKLETDVAFEVGRILSSDAEATTLSPRAKQELNRVASEDGADAVACILEQEIYMLLSTGGPPNPDFEHEAGRARMFLVEVGTVAER